ncbi:MAG: SCO family protein [Sphingobacteriales bacterium]|nr:MAG: SCO family protein [Sphingobacteriales bacterium]
MIKKFPLKKLIILVAILALPGFLYYLLQAKGKNRYKPLPIYGPKTVLKTFTKKRRVMIPDTLYHTIKPFNLVTQSGVNLASADFKNKIVVVNFFYTRNQNLNTIVNKRLKSLYNEYKDNKMIRFVSITIDEKYDTPAQLKKYADALKVNTAKWNFCTVDSNQVFELAKNSFYVNAKKMNDSDFIVSEKLILLDANQRIRGYYDGTSVSATLQITDEIKVQITEELRKIKAEN